MGATKGPCRLEFPVGTTVKIRSASVLEEFLRDWKFHDPLRPEQLGFAGNVAKVEWTGIYHGGGELYALKDIPGIWHECCLEPLK